MSIFASLVLAVLLGLMAGFFFAWSVSAMPGFAQTDPSVWITAMNAINPAVRNAVFGVAFFGPVLLGPITAWLLRDTGGVPWALAAWAVYAVGAVGVTFMVNVPINVAMESWNAAAPPADWRAVQERWTLFNHLRTVASTLAFVLALIAFRRA